MDPLRTAMALALVAGCSGSDPDTDPPTVVDTDTDAPEDTDVTGPTGDTGVETPLYTVDLHPIDVAPWTDPADVFHPVGTTGQQFPVVVLLQGVNVERRFYRQFASRVSAHGYLVVVPDHRRWVTLLNGLYAEVGQIEPTVAAVLQEAGQAGSPLEGLADPDRSAVLGHSLGGVAVLEAVGGECSPLLCTNAGYGLPASLRAAVTYGTNRKPPIGSDIPTTANAGLPVLLVQGTADGTIQEADTETTWNRIQQPPKALLFVDGANHYSITNDQNPPGAIPEGSPATLDQAAGLDLLATWTVRFLDAHVKNDPSALAAFPAGSSTPEPGLALTVELP